MKKGQTLEIFYDGACHLCSREISHYIKKDKNHILKPINIASPEFKAKEFGLNAKLIQKKMHVRNADGIIFTGVDAFIQIWNRFPQYKCLSKMASNPLIKPFLKIGYVAFANIRPFLPKRKDQICLIPERE